MRVGVLAVQGAFAEMAAYWRKKGADTFEIRQLADLGRGMDLLALPGGESTVQGKLLKDLGLFDPIKKLIEGGLPVFATCAGLILLAERIDDPGRRDKYWIAGVLRLLFAGKHHHSVCGSKSGRDSIQYLPISAWVSFWNAKLYWRNGNQAVLLRQ